MLLTLTLPRIGEHMTTAVVRTLHGAPGSALGMGAKLLDVADDLSAVAAQDCPPVALYRIALRDRCWLREWCVAPGAEHGIGDLLARFTTEADEPLTGPPARAVRIAIAGIVDPSEWWGGPA